VIDSPTLAGGMRHDRTHADRPVGSGVEHRIRGLHQSCRGRWIPDAFGPCLDPRLPEALAERGYHPGDAANRFVRGHTDDIGQLTLIVDILAPSYQGTLVPNQRHGDLVVDEVPGLVLALHRPATLLDVSVELTGGEGISLHIALPDVLSALCLKALAYRGRFAAKDAVDLWRLLSAAYAAGVREADWPGSVTGRQAAQVLHRFFGAPGATGLKQLSAAPADRTRMQALVRHVVARAPSG
jgi:hypothetical protein